jgi:acetyltransferase-like isoleucine patch superfamily enzyme
MNIKEFIKKQPFFTRKIRLFLKMARIFREVNWLKTLYLNFKTQDFKVAIRFPILVYGRLKIISLSGKIKIEAPIRTGMIRLGLNTDKFSASKGSALLWVRGILIFKGRFIASADYTVDVDVNVNGVLSIGDMCFWGGNVKVRCWNKIIIGNVVDITVECQIFDSNFHYLKNIETGKIYNCSKEIVIGDFNWIGNRTTIMKGTCLPDYSIVGSNSLCNKDYRINAPACPFIAGIPAKIINSGFIRVHNDNELTEYFLDNPEAAYYHGDVGIENKSELRSSFFSNRII